VSLGVFLFGRDAQRAARPMESLKVRRYSCLSGEQRRLLAPTEVKTQDCSGPDAGDGDHRPYRVDGLKIQRGGLGETALP